MANVRASKECSVSLKNGGTKRITVRRMTFAANSAVKVFKLDRTIKRVSMTRVTAVVSLLVSPRWAVDMTMPLLELSMEVCKKRLKELHSKELFQAALVDTAVVDTVVVVASLAKPLLKLLAEVSYSMIMDIATDF